MKQQEFLERYTPDAIEATAGQGLFAETMLAQAIHESGWGDSLLAKKYNNFFGIKADPSWKGDKVYLTTHEYINGIRTTVQAPFRVYPTAQASFSDRVKFLKDNPRYKKVLQAATPHQQAEELQRAGYATDPQYAGKLKSIIDRYKLILFVELKKKLMNKKTLIIATVFLAIAGFMYYRYFRRK